MAAKNIQTRNLTTSITKTLESLICDRNDQTRNYQEDLAAKRVNTDYVREATRTDDFMGKLLNQAKRATNNVNAMEKRYQEVLADRLAMKGNNATEALLAETRATKTWSRIERDLAGKDTSTQIDVVRKRIEASIKREDWEMVAAINSEAPDYFRSNDVNEPEKLIELIIRNSDTSLAQAHSDIIEARKLRDVTTHNVEMISRTFDNDLKQGIDGYIRGFDKIPYYVDPAEAVRNKIQEANEELKAAIDAANARGQEEAASTDIGHIDTTDLEAPDNDIEATTEQVDRFSNNTHSIGPNESFNE